MKTCLETISSVKNADKVICPPSGYTDRITTYKFSVLLKNSSSQQVFVTRCPMESFLTTLPPYVHDFLNKYPPTDVFNVLRELICFAVLYSNDRERILAMSKELMEKGADQRPVILLHLCLR